MKKSAEDRRRMQDSDGTTEPARTDLEAVRDRVTKMRSPLETLPIECEQTGGN
jgi:hypothetical protein